MSLLKLSQKINLMYSFSTAISSYITSCFKIYFEKDNNTLLFLLSFFDFLKDRLKDIKKVLHLFRTFASLQKTSFTIFIQKNKLTQKDPIYRDYIFK
jgi:hypothetical protein